MIQKICKACVLTAFFATAPAYALQSDSKQPIQIEADQGSLDQNNQSTTFTGNVIIKQGTLNIRAGSVNVSRNDKGEPFMKASGSPVITYNTKTEVYTINGSSKSGAKSAAKSGRVSVVIQPSSTQKIK